MNIDLEIATLIQDLRRLVVERNPQLDDEIARTGILRNPKEFFMWLQKLSELGELSAEAEKKLTELYGLLR